MSSWGCNSVWRLTPAGVGVGTPPTLVVQQDHYHEPEVLGGQLQRSEHITHLPGLG